MLVFFRSRWSFWFGCFLFWGLVNPLWSQTAVFIPGVAGGSSPDWAYPADIAQIRGNPRLNASPTAVDSGNWGQAQFVSLGCDFDYCSRGLLRFPLASLAGRATHLRRARLILFLRMPYLSNLPLNKLPSLLHFELYRVRPENAAWVEGASTAGAIQPGAVSWSGPLTGAKSWRGNKGCGLAGTDFDAAPVSSATLAQQDWLNGQPLLFPIDHPDFLRSWIAQPQSNAGFLLRSSTLESLPANSIFLMNFHSDDAATPLLRPRLEVDYDAMSDESLTQASFQSGVTGASYDAMATSLFGGNDGSYGASDSLVVGCEPKSLASQPWRSLLRFDVTRLRAYAHTVRWLRLTLTVQSTQGAGPSANPLAAIHLLELDRVSSANAAWTEGRRAAGEAEPGAATWGWLAQGRLAWAGGSAAGAGLGQPGVDYDAQPLASRLLVPAELHEGDLVSFDFPNTGFLYQWIENPAANSGFRLASPTLESAGQLAPGTLGRINFYSDDASVPAKRPRLDLFYAPAAPRTAAAAAWRLAE